MKKHAFCTVIIALFIGITFPLSAQVAITVDGSAPDPSAMLDIKSTNKGILIPRMGTADRNQIPSPATGLLIYNTTTNLFNYYNGIYWYQIEAAFISSVTGSTRSGGGASINATPNTPADSSAMLDVNNLTRGILIPRTTPDLIISPAVGLLIYNISTNNLEYFSNNGWRTLSANSVGVAGASGSQSSIGVSISTTGSDAHQSSILDVSSNDKGLLLPRLTDIERNGILPVTGLTIFNTTSNALEYYNGSGWYSTMVWTCGDTLVDTRDGHKYRTVSIGNQCWLAENLNIGIMHNSSVHSTNNSLIEKYCINNDPDNCMIYGGLYQWDEMMQYVTTSGAQGICPPVYGWHLPTDKEWADVISILGGESLAGGKMKSTGTIEAGTGLWYSPNMGATNESEFNGLPGGESGTEGTVNEGYWGNFWSSTKCLHGNIESVLQTYDASIHRWSNPEGWYTGYSVRCLSLSTTVLQPPSQPADPHPRNDASNQSINSILSWSCSDPENDPLTFDVYFSTSNPPTLVSSGQANTTYDPGALQLNTQYFWKINAHDDHNHITEGSLWSFFTETQPWLCGTILVDPRDGQTYNTIGIGTQCWMAKNLNIGSKIPGTTTMSNNGIIEKYCYNNDDNNCSVYGGLYLWGEVMNYNYFPGSQGICPSGWHMPKDAEMTTLQNFLGGIYNAGGMIKETGTSHWLPPNTGATNESGFTGLPGGLRDGNGGYSYKGSYTYFWTSEEDCSYGSQSFGLFYNNSNIDIGITFPDNGLSVRCIRD